MYSSDSTEYSGDTRQCFFKDLAQPKKTIFSISKFCLKKKLKKNYLAKNQAFCLKKELNCLKKTLKKHWHTPTASPGCWQPPRFLEYSKPLTLRVLSLRLRKYVLMKVYPSACHLARHSDLGSFCLFLPSMRWVWRGDKIGLILFSLRQKNDWDCDRVEK